jgi:DNA-binding MarR family transcriptional regulator
MIKNEAMGAQSLLTIEGQIIYLLSKEDLVAGEIYKRVSASQPTVSKRLARLLDRGVIIIETSAADRRLSIYKLSDEYHRDAGWINSRELLATLSQK